MVCAPRDREILTRASQQFFSAVPDALAICASSAAICGHPIFTFLAHDFESAPQIGF